MRYCILFLLIFISTPIWAQNTPALQAENRVQGVLIRDIVMEGFILGDKNQFLKIFKPYRNKHLSTTDMDAILEQIQIIYEREGYQQLVSITYQVVKHRLVYTALMTS